MPGVHGATTAPTPYPRAPGERARRPPGGPRRPRPARRRRRALPDAVLAVEGVTFAYQDGTVALRDLTLAVPRHRKTAILGANGSGKSTLFLHLDGILKPQRGPGAARRAASGLRPGRPERPAPARGLVFQDPDSQLFAASVRQDISFGPINLGLPDDVVRQKVAAAVADTQIEDLVDRPTHLLSYGQKKRVAIAGVLAMEPEVIVADEPTAGLDPEATARLSASSTACTRNGRTIVISTHDVEMALAWADHTLVMRRGELLGAGPPETVFADAGPPEERPPGDPHRPGHLPPPARRGVPPDGPRPRTAAELAGLVTPGAASRTGPARRCRWVHQGARAGRALTRCGGDAIASPGGSPTAGVAGGPPA